MIKNAGKAVGQAAKSVVGKSDAQIAAKKDKGAILKKKIEWVDKEFVAQAEHETVTKYDQNKSIQQVEKDIIMATDPAQLAFVMALNQANFEPNETAGGIMDLFDHILGKIEEDADKQAKKQKEALEDLRKKIKGHKQDSVENIITALRELGVSETVLKNIKKNE